MIATIITIAATGVAVASAWRSHLDKTASKRLFDDTVQAKKDAERAALSAASALKTVNAYEPKVQQQIADAVTTAIKTASQTIPISPALQTLVDGVERLRAELKTGKPGEGKDPWAAGRRKIEEHTRDPKVIAQMEEIAEQRSVGSGLVAPNPKMQSDPRIGRNL
jgi:hypothetical protein